MGRLTTGAKVALFAVATLAAALYLFRFVDKTRQGKGGYTVWVLASDAVGVARNSQVRMAGIPIGVISDIRLQDGKARIDIRVNPEVALYEDASGAKVTSSLLGEYFISLAPGTAGKRQLEDGDRVPYFIEAATTDQLLKDLAEIASDVRKVSQSLAATVGSDKGQENIDKTLQNLAEATEELNKVVRENRATIRNILENVQGITTGGQPRITEILENVAVATREVRLMLAPDGGGQGGGPAPGEVRQIVEKVNRAASSLERALGDLEGATGRIARGEGTLGRLSRDETLIDEVEGAAQGINEFIGGLSRLRTVVGLRSDYQFLTSTVKSYVALRLQPREDKYYLIELVNDPRGLTRIEQTDVQTTNPNQPRYYREVRTVTTNSFRFSLQFAQSFGPFTGRFGIKESSGGVGLDLAVFDGRLELVQDLFGFGEVVIPRWRIALGYEFVDRLWLLAGVDDALDPNRRDYFVGLALRFDDEDLKSILPFAPSP